MTRRIVPLAALVAALAIAGCGGSSQPSASGAKASYASVRTQITTLGSSIAAAIGAAGRETDAQLASAFAALERLKVPDSLTAKRDALRDALTKGTDDLGAIASAARASDASAARAAAERLIADSATIKQARAAFEQALGAAAR
jgi:hypothetical protein